MFDSDIYSDKMWVLVQVIPYPRTDVEWEMISIRLRDCGIDDVSIFKPGNYPIFNPKLLRPCVFFEIPRKQRLFLGGEIFEACMCGPFRKKHTIFIDSPCNRDGTVVTNNEGGGNNECGTEIRLTLCPPEVDTQRFEKLQGSEERKARRCEYWKKVISGCPKPFNYIFYPLYHLLCPNVPG